jgi:perosamine synthetase
MKNIQKVIPLYAPPIINDASNAIKNCFESGWWGYGLACKELESKFTNNRGGWAIATSSCTSALYIAARLIKQSPQDEVIVPAITWISSAMAFLSAGFNVKLADVNQADLMINIESIKSLISNKTRAIVIVHLYGQKSNVVEIRNLCNENNIILIEDCAHRIDIEDTPLGDYCCYSFNTVKEIPCGEGGLIWAKDLKEENKARSISYLGMEINTWQRSSNTKHKDLVFSKNPGLKLQLNDISASIVNTMFYHKDNFRRKRKLIFNTYEQYLSELNPIVSMIERKTDDSFLMYIILLNGTSREKLREGMALDGVSTSVHYPSLSQHPLIKNPFTPNADVIAKNILTLPCYPDLSPEDQLFIIRSLKNNLKYS